MSKQRQRRSGERRTGAPLGQPSPSAQAPESSGSVDSATLFAGLEGDDWSVDPAAALGESLFSGGDGQRLHTPILDQVAQQGHVADPGPVLTGTSGGSTGRRK